MNKQCYLENTQCLWNKLLTMTDNILQLMHLQEDTGNKKGCGHHLRFPQKHSLDLSHSLCWINFLILFLIPTFCEKVVKKNKPWPMNFRGSKYIWCEMLISLIPQKMMLHFVISFRPRARHGFYPSIKRLARPDNQCYNRTLGWWLIVVYLETR